MEVNLQELAIINLEKDLQLIRLKGLVEVLQQEIVSLKEAAKKEE